MKERIQKLLNNYNNVKLNEESKKEKIEKFIQNITSSITNMNEALIELGVNCKVTLMPFESITTEIKIVNNKDEKTIYSAIINEDIQTLSLGYGDNQYLKTYYISLNEDTYLEDLYTKKLVDLENILMIDLKRIIEMNNF